MSDWRKSDWGEGSRQQAIAEVRDQRSEVRDQRSEIKDQRSKIRDQRSEIRDQKSSGPFQGAEREGKKDTDIRENPRHSPRLKPWVNDAKII